MFVVIRTFEVIRTGLWSSYMIVAKYMWIHNWGHWLFISDERKRFIRN